MAYSVFTRNRLPHMTLQGKCPIQIINPTVDMEQERKRFRPFGQKVYVATYADGKLSDRAARALLVGYTNTVGIYQVMLENRRLTVAKNPQPRTEQQARVVELVDDSEAASLPKDITVETSSPPETKDTTAETPSPPLLTATSQRPKRSTAGKPALRIENDPKYTGHEAHLSISQALASEKAPQWEAAMRRELAMLEKYQVYEWVDKVPYSAKTVDTKWVVKEKEEKAVSDPKRYKARLTARGFTQRHGIDYHETYAPVCREESWRLLICIALEKNMKVRQYDIEGAFLNGPLQEELYVKDKHATGDKAWKLLKSLYGTKQAARNWNLVIDDILRGLEFQQCKDDPGLYFREQDGSIITIHVDDLLCAFQTDAIQYAWEQEIKKHFTLEEKGLPKRFLGMDVKWNNLNKTVMISGASTILTLGEKWHISKRAKTPYLITTEDDSLADAQSFQTLVGSLLFVARMWRPDIRYAVNKLCTKASKPNITDIRRGCRIISYLLNTQDEGIILKGATDTIDIFTDAGEESLEEKATTGILVMCGTSLIAWNA